MTLAKYGAWMFGGWLHDLLHPKLTSQHQTSNSRWAMFPPLSRRKTQPRAPNPEHLPPQETLSTQLDTPNPHKSKNRIKSQHQIQNMQTFQGYLAREKQHPPLGPPWGLRHITTVGSRGSAVSCERNNPVQSLRLISPRLLVCSGRV